MIDGIKNKLDMIADICERYTDVIEKESDILKSELGIKSSEELEKQFTALNEEHRLLQIGIIGRVKAGKSTLLNAVFFDGNDILPKAATPMTASLTVLRQGDNCSAKVDFFSAGDISKIEEENQKYELQFQEAYQREKKKQAGRLKEKLFRRVRNDGQAADEMEDKCRRSAARAVSDESLKAAHEQYEQMRASGEMNRFKAGAQPEVIDASSIDVLAAKLKTYVGSDGKFMPFTKSVELYLPQESLKDIAVIDTPGLNDPVSSRSERTRAYLDNCDVVFIVSSSGQFVSREDFELMDQLYQKKGVRELYVVASQGDNQLFGDVLEHTHGDLDRGIAFVRSQLAESMYDSINALRANSKEIKGQFDQLLESGGKRLLFTSGICHSIAKRYENKDSWDSAMRHAWENLTKTYPDYFASHDAALANLDKLGGITTIQATIADVRKEKDDILHKRQSDLLTGWQCTVDEYHKKLIKILSEKIAGLENNDIISLKKKHDELVQLKNEISDKIDSEFSYCTVDFIQQLHEKIKQKQQICFNETKSEIDNAQETKTKTNSYKTGGFFGFFKDTKYYTTTIETIRCGAVRNQLHKLRDDLEDSFTIIVKGSKKYWLENMPKKIGAGLSKIQMPETVNLDSNKLIQALRRQVHGMTLPEIDLSGCRVTCNDTGTKHGSAKDKYLEEVQVYIESLRSYFRNQTNAFLHDVERTIKNFDLSSNLFDALNSELDEQAKLLQNKQTNLNRLRACLKELREVEDVRH